MDEIKKLIDEVIAFRDERDWAQFHNGKDLALALSVEASELLELFLWKTPEQVNVERLKEELADVLSYALILAHNYQLNVGEIVRNKMKLNAEKYPVKTAKGKMTKYKYL